MHNSIIFYLCITINKLDYDQIMRKLRYVRSKVYGKINTSEIVPSVDLFIAIDWGTTSVGGTQHPVQFKGNPYSGRLVYYGRLHISQGYKAISRKVVGKSALDNPERYCGWF